jgi:hypothetical protein
MYVSVSPQSQATSPKHPVVGEPCRMRKTRCDISEKPVCSECVRRGKASACVLRTKARVKRCGPLSRGPLSDAPDAPTLIHDAMGSPHAPMLSSPASHTSSAPFVGPPDALELPSNSAIAPQIPLHASERSSFISQVEDKLLYRARHDFGTSTRASQLMEGLELHLALLPETVFGNRPRRYHGLDDIGLTPGAPASASTAREWIQVHFEGIHHNTPFLHLPLIYRICDGMFGSPIDSRQRSIPEPNPDELALLFAVMALGRLRAETWDPVLCRYRQLSQDTPRTDEPAERFGDVSLALFNLANEQLDNLASPSELAVQALHLLHTFVSNTMMNRRSRDYVARAVMMAHEMGLNRSIPQGFQSVDNGSLKRRAILYLYVYFSDV